MPYNLYLIAVLIVRSPSENVIKVHNLPTFSSPLSLFQKKIRYSDKDFYFDMNPFKKRHDITEILLRLALSTNQSINPPSLFLENVAPFTSIRCNVVYNCMSDMTGIWVHSRFLVWSVLFIFLVFCVVLFVLFVFVLCLVYPMLPVSLNCPFLIVPLVFSNICLFSSSKQCLLQHWKLKS